MELLKEDIHSFNSVGTIKLGQKFGYFFVVIINLNLKITR